MREDLRNWVYLPPIRSSHCFFLVLCAQSGQAKKGEEEGKSSRRAECEFRKAREKKIRFSCLTSACGLPAVPRWWQRIPVGIGCFVWARDSTLCLPRTVP
ncbi:hypothetical protein RSOLAG1IB_01875 [Rhizoctonia solani AG-1 IB]|uniref:Uncharacterized protein n=1 Tax=Thanatephorus cucumeris (strain AG1-IB / isolate 7/3/14) TaxID=1108050 RepID=A0A0B7FHZ9_THACB|nr:hypothetical protein RSOLAG1IB_01875 [Rhizoctonia solani AG-1 IB]